MIITRGTHIKKGGMEGVKSQVPYLVKAYSLDDTTFYMGGAWLDIPNTLTDAYVLLRNSHQTIPSIKQGCYVSSTKSKIFSNIGSKTFIDPRFDQKNLQDIALDRNTQLFSEMKKRRACNQVVANTTQQPFPERSTFVTNGTYRGFRPKKVRRVILSNFCQRHFMLIKSWSHKYNKSYTSFLKRPWKNLNKIKRHLTHFNFYAARKGIQSWVRLIARAQYWNKFIYTHSFNPFKGVPITNTLPILLRQYVSLFKKSFEYMIAPRRRLVQTRKRLARFRFKKRKFLRPHKGLRYGGYEPFNKVQFRRFRHPDHSDLPLSWRLSHFNVKHKRVFYGLLQYYRKQSTKFWPPKRRRKKKWPHGAKNRADFQRKVAQGKIILKPKTQITPPKKNYPEKTYPQKIYPSSNPTKADPATPTLQKQ